MWKYTQWRVSYSHRIAWILAIVVWFKKNAAAFLNRFHSFAVNIRFWMKFQYALYIIRIFRPPGKARLEYLKLQAIINENDVRNSILVVAIFTQIQSPLQLFLSDSFRKLSNIPFHWQQPPDSSDACDPSPFLLKYVNFCLLLFETFAVVFIFFFTFHKPLSTYLFTFFTQWCHICIHWQNSVVNDCKAKINIIQ